MEKFGRFRNGEKDPFETYEGDFLEHVSDDYIRVIARWRGDAGCSPRDHSLAKRRER